MIANVKRHAQAVANAYVRLFLEHVWEPFQEAGEPEDRWPEMRETLDRLRPLAVESLVAIFQIVMTRDGREGARARAFAHRPAAEARRRHAPSAASARGKL